MCDLVRAMGYEAEGVPHGLAAVDAVIGGDYDAVLMDCHMPVLDGFDATRRIRQASCRQPVIIAVTGDGNRDDCLAAGMDEHLTKPVRPSVLRATLTQWLERDGRPSDRPPRPDVAAT